MQVTEQAIEKAKKCFAVWRFEDAPDAFKARSKHDDPEWLIATSPDNIADGLPFWIDLLDPEDLERINLNNGLTILVA